MYCISCGKLMANAASHCPNCGTGAPDLEGLTPPGPAQISPGMPQAPPDRYGRPEPNGMATAALVLGILALCSGGVLGLVGLVLGIIGLRRANASNGAMGGQGTATAGIITSVISFAWVFVLLAVFIPGYASMRSVTSTFPCEANLRNLTLAAETYAADWDDCLPLADNWGEALKPYVSDPDAFNCPEASSLGYAYNREMSGTPIAWGVGQIDIPLIFDGPDGSLSTGGPELLETRHNNDAVVGMLNYRTEVMDLSSASGLNWGPYEEPQPWDETIDLDDFEFEPMEAPLINEAPKAEDPSTE